MPVPIHVSTTVGVYLMVDWVYQFCLVSLAGYDTRVNIIILQMVDFDVILGKGWVSPYHVILDFYAKTMTLAMLSRPKIEWKDSSGSYHSKVISYIRGQKLIDKDCLSCFSFI